MPRQARVAPGGLIYHVWNRAVAKTKIFKSDADFAAFERVLIEAKQRFPLRILDYCIMQNHWHFVVWPEEDGELSTFFRWLTLTHAMRWRVSHETVGDGRLYQGRFKNLPVQEDLHLLTLCRYVERNPLTAGLVKHAQDWRFGSLWTRQQGTPEQRALLSKWPVACPRNWIETVNTAMTAKELDRIQLTLNRSQPFGDDAWTAKTVKKLGLQHTIRREGRPSTKPKSKGIK
jgi:putative transposase